MKLTNFQIKLAWIVGIGSIICLWIAFPFIFKTLLSFYSFPEKFNEFGAFGDIYGSLNTLISSIALCAVAFSTWLQVTSLKETRKANKDQVILAREAHDEQIKESRNAIFTSKFYSLLQYKDAKLKHINFTSIDESIKNTEKQNISGFELMETLAHTFYHDILRYHSTSYTDFSLDELRNDLMKESSKHVSNSISSLISFFYIHCEIVKLIADADIDDSDKEFFKSTFYSSMFQTEQIFLFWISPMYDFTKILKKGFVFNQIGYDENLKKYALKYYDASFFSDAAWKKIFAENSQNNETQP